MRAHWDGLAAADLFTVEVLTLARLRRYFVFFLVELQSRRVHIAEIHPQPCGPWMEQLARNATDPGHESADTGVAPKKPVVVDQVRQMAMALRPRPNASTISSRYGSQVFARGAWPRRGEDVRVDGHRSPGPFVARAPS